MQAVRVLLCRGLSEMGAAAAGAQLSTCEGSHMPSRGAQVLLKRAASWHSHPCVPQEKKLTSICRQSSGHPVLS